MKLNEEQFEAEQYETHRKFVEMKEKMSAEELEKLEIIEKAGDLLQSAGIKFFGVFSTGNRDNFEQDEKAFWFNRASYNKDFQKNVENGSKWMNSILPTLLSPYTRTGEVNFISYFNGNPTVIFHHGTFQMISPNEGTGLHDNDIDGGNIPNN